MKQRNHCEYFSLAQAASFCCVSEERFTRWVNSGLLPVVHHNGQQLIRSEELIHHLVRHNIPIPERLLQGTVKKILVIFLQLVIPRTVSREIIQGLYRLREKTSCILECIPYNSETELKIITFKPDIIFLLGKNSISKKIEQHLSGVLPKPTPLYSFTLSDIIDLESIVQKQGGLL